MVNYQQSQYLALQKAAELRARQAREQQKRAIEAERDASWRNLGQQLIGQGVKLGVDRIAEEFPGAQAELKKTQTQTAAWEQQLADAKRKAAIQAAQDKEMAGILPPAPSPMLQTQRRGGVGEAPARGRAIEAQAGLGSVPQEALERARRVPRPRGTPEIGPGSPEYEALRQGPGRQAPSRPQITTPDMPGKPIPRPGYKPEDAVLSIGRARAKKAKSDEFIKRNEKTREQALERLAGLQKKLKRGRYDYLYRTALEAPISSTHAQPLSDFIDERDTRPVGSVKGTKSRGMNVKVGYGKDFDKPISAKQAIVKAEGTERDEYAKGAKLLAAGKDPGHDWWRLNKMLLGRMRADVDLGKSAAMGSGARTDHQIRAADKGRKHRSEESALTRQHQSYEGAVDRLHRSDEAEKGRKFRGDQAHLGREHQAREGDLNREAREAAKLADLQSKKEDRAAKKEAELEKTFGRKRVTETTGDGTSETYWVPREGYEPPRPTAPSKPAKSGPKLTRPTKLKIRQQVWDMHQLSDREKDEEYQRLLKKHGYPKAE